MPARTSEIGMIGTWRGGAIVTGAFVDDVGALADAALADAALADAALADAALGEALAIAGRNAAESRVSNRAVGRSNIGSSVRGVSRRVKRSFSYLETSA